VFVTFLTDFGTADYFAAACKGALLTVCPSARAFDFTHDIPPQDVDAAAFTLLAGYSAWPSGTIHVAVVDPGVGSARRPLLIEAGGYYFIGPDNGLFSYILDRHADARVRHITNKHQFRQPVNPSFHGRDVFAPVAGALRKGVAARVLGPEVTDAVRLAPLTPAQNPDGSLGSRIIHIDRFGNCVTGFALADLDEQRLAQGFCLTANNHEITRLQRFFAESVDAAPFAIRGSAGFLEISVKGASAAQLLNLQRGAVVALSFEK
jgi:hypothetical protein